MPNKYQKKPVIVEAHQWFKNGDHPLDFVGKILQDPLGGSYLNYEGKVVRFYINPEVSGETICSKCGHKNEDHGWIDTLEDGHNVCPGDWIITGVQGEYYPCKPDIFEQTYTPVLD